MTDDQTLESMKVLEQTNRLLGGEGVTFDNAFVSFSLCCPSRSTFLTGQYAHNHGVQGNSLPLGGYYKLDSTNTLAVWLQRAGYTTIHLGKYLNSYGTRDPHEIPPGWSEWHASVDPTTYQYYDYTLNENGQLTHPCESQSPACYQTDLYAQKAQEIIRRRAAEAQPYFLWVAFIAPHAGGPPDPDDPGFPPTPSPAPRHRNYFAGTELPLAPSFNEADVTDKPPFIRSLPRLNARGVRGIRENYQQELESLLAVDEAVQGIVETLRDTGTLDNTLIFFTSDNGFFHGEHRIPNGKILAYEPSIRVPLIVRGPGIPQNVHRSQLVANIDLAPTIVEAADAQPGRTMDGRSLYPLLRDGGKEYGRDIVIEDSPGAAHFSALRTQHYLYVEYDSGARELYDLLHDPDELVNLYGDPAHAGLQAALARRLASLRACTGAGCKVGPAAVFTVRSPLGSAGCLRGPLALRVRGARSLSAVTFTIGGRPVGTEARAPFRLVVPRLRLPHGAIRLRARVSTGGDQLVTLDRTARFC
ncbi:MAG: N-acetylglucosamine-6-sulfatase [Gaiellaceae bacterium]|nr:N-acetylglucosamine-6-sulfatase [Gaiellaceae bacterium]